MSRSIVPSVRLATTGLGEGVYVDERPPPATTFLLDRDESDYLVGADVLAEPQRYYSVRNYLHL
jgi:hypothetical protein